MRTVILVLIAVAALAVGLLFWHVQTLGPPPVPASGPQVLSIEFPKQITADGNEVSGKVHFRVPSGTLVRADFQVVKAMLFTSFSFDPQVHNEKQGSFVFSISTVIPQQITLRVTLTDEQGQTSPVKEFSFTVNPAPFNPGNP
ncbi:MAG TPA: hypothetical protein ENI60_03615 [Candidatus Fraserbacteria bacterium]|nr:hypothetical protein [Candidatus Fraserbacteria bacterium]